MVGSCFLLRVMLMMIMSLGAAIKIDSDGGYKDLVIRIASDGSVPENECPKILYNLKVSKPGVIAINL